MSPRDPAPQADRPIGIFDSGIGGLTVARAIRERLPEEQLLYFGDSAHLPYGDKSQAAIQAYSIKIVNVLLEMGCKAIVIACHSASSAADELLREYVGKRALVINVIDPAVQLVGQVLGSKEVGVIGTRQTIGSGIYPKKFEKRAGEVNVHTLATPLLAPMIEEGFVSGRISKDVLNEYLTREELAGIDTLILGCTHYPLIQPQIEEFYQGKVRVLDSASMAADFLQNELTTRGLLAEKSLGADRFLVSDYTPSFEATARQFFGEAVELEAYPLWE